MQTSSELNSDSAADATSSSSESGNEHKCKTSCRETEEVSDESDANNDSGSDNQQGTNSRLGQQKINADSVASNDAGGDSQQTNNSRPGQHGKKSRLGQSGKKAANNAPQLPRKRGRPRKHNTERKERPDHTCPQGSAWEEVFGVPAPPPEGTVGPVQCDTVDPSMGGLGFFDDAANISIPDAEYDEVLMQFSSPRVGFFEVGKVLRRHNLYYQVGFRFWIVRDWCLPLQSFFAIYCDFLRLLYQCLHHAVS